MALVHHVSNTTSERVIGAAIEVHRHLGPGLLESTYEECLCLELQLRGLPFERQRPVPLDYKGIRCKEGYVVDPIVGDILVVEVKSVDILHPVHTSQLLTYMRILQVSAGLLINFNVDKLVSGVRRRLL